MFDYDEFVHWAEDTLRENGECDPEVLLDDTGQVVIYTGLFLHEDGSLNSEPQEEDTADEPERRDGYCRECSVEEHDMCSLNPNCPCCLDTLRNM